jgi:hypothetical protein
MISMPTYCAVRSYVGGEDAIGELASPILKGHSRPRKSPLQDNKVSHKESILESLGIKNYC